MTTPRMTDDALQVILASHAAWRTGSPGQRADLTRANLTMADLTRANLTGADLTDADLTGANLTMANLTMADLTGANLTMADLTGANLTGADLTDADLAGANLARARGLPSAPIIPCLNTAIIAQVEADGHALDMHTWHRCATTHCRAGWAITLAGEAGAALEARYGPNLAGALLYAAAYPDRRIPDFYASNAAALADLRASAAQEAQEER